MTLVNTATGEIVETKSLATVDPSSALAVTSYLEQARTWLATAVENTGPEYIALKRAEIATYEDLAKHLGLSKEIRDDAGEMVRRAEYALTKSLAQGREDGTIWRPEDNLRDGRFPDSPRRDQMGASKPRPSDFIGKGREMNDLNAMAELEPAEFDEVLAEARAEGNLSRNNVAAKSREKSGRADLMAARPVVTRDMRAEMIRNLADQGLSSRQMPAKVGVTEETIRQIARDFDIEIPADRVILKTRRHNSHRIAFETVTALEGLAMGVDLINYSEIDPQEARQWADSLNHSLRAINRFHKQIKETTHD